MEKSFGHRPARPEFGERKSFGGPRPSFGGPRPSFGDRGGRPSFGDRKPFGDRPSFGDRPRPSFGGDRGGRPSFGDRKPFGDRPSFGGPRKSFGDRPSFGGPRRDFGDRSDSRPKFNRDDRGDSRPPYTPRTDGTQVPGAFGSSRPPFNREGGDRKPFGDRKPWEDRGPRKSFGDRPSFGGPRKSFGDRPSFGGPRRDFGDRKPFGDRPRFDGPRRDFDDKPRFERSDDRGDSRPDSRSSFNRDGAEQFGQRATFAKRNFTNDFEATKARETREYSPAMRAQMMGAATNSEDILAKDMPKRAAPPVAPNKFEATTSWGDVSNWYDNHLENSDDTYHSQVILPNLERHLALKDGEKVLELACGQGFFARRFKAAHSGTSIDAIDISAELVGIAKKRAEEAKVDVTFHEGSVENLSQFALESFDKLYMVLAIQNIKDLGALMAEASRVLTKGGEFHVVMNHPVLRIPRETSWEYVDEKNIQARRIDAYLMETQYEMDMHPGMTASPKTLTFHRPMQSYVKAAAKNGLAMNGMEEWISYKTSDNGPRADAENKARKEFPMFMYVKYTKI